LLQDELKRICSFNKMNWGYFLFTGWIEDIFFLQDELRVFSFYRMNWGYFLFTGWIGDIFFLQDELGRICSAGEVCWQGFQSLLNTTIQDTVTFAKKVPGFSRLQQEDQISLIKGGCFEVCQIVKVKS
jgi:hypothetical protein